MNTKTTPLPSSEYALLGLLYEKPTHGYELHKLITDPEGIGMIWGVKMANLYAQLDKLQKKGMIKGTLLASESRPARTQFQISEKGKKEFNNWLGITVKHPRDFRQDFMLRFYFTQKYSPNSLNELCAKQLAECEEWLSNTVKRNTKINPENSFLQYVGEFRVSQIKSQIHWLKWLQDQPIN